MAEPPQKRPVKFVASDQDDTPGPRFFADASHQKSIYAHLKPDPPQPESSGTSNRSGTLPNSPQSPEQNSGSSSAREVASQLIELSASRFVGDLSPESIFIEAASKIARDPSRRNPSDIGTWLPARRSDDEGDARREQSAPTQGREPAGSSRADDGPISLRTLSGRVASSPGSAGHRVDAPQSHDASEPARPLKRSTVYPPDEDYEHICAAYLDRFQPMWPILKVADIHATRRPKCVKDIIFRQAISIAACVEPSASEYLRLEPGGPILSFPDFQRPLSKSVFSFLDEQVLADRTDHIRALFLVFFYQPARASESDLPSLVFSQAMHYSVSIGIHLVGSGAQDERSKEAETLYCALWALDRMNAAFHGRPCLLHDRDTDRDLSECIAAQEEPGFRLLLNVCIMLDKVICLYRPRSKADETVVLPVFESMIMDAGADKAAPWIHTSVEIFYHAVSVLSCRQPSSAFAPSAPDQAHLPHPNINARRSLSADRIADAVSFALSFPTSPDRITVVPFVPYALALSLSVSYRKMRYSKIPLYRLRGKVRFKEIVGMLKKLGETFTCARVNAGLGEAILQEMDKTAKGLVSSGAAAAAAAAAATAAANSTTPSPTDARPASRKALPAEVTLGSKRNVYVREAERQRHGSAAATPRPIQAGQSPLQQLPTPNLQPGPGRPPPAPLAAAPGQGAVVAQQPGTTQPLPATALGDMLDVDIFGHFDPGFDLSTADAALSANLDMGFPQMWTTPWPNWPS
ncbi:putative fungal specific transcription factor [Diaporthe ampelina]|uniref:Putative fungal specific transcription factor n=1 Tax=Diaporthe ampelina TaxID=1214573 RepID=A0A0G2H4X2_9PEZI|nr:putative fungal specific transcription factor [Diaporthe ampelina]